MNSSFKPVVRNQQVLTPHYARYRAQLSLMDDQLDHRLHTGRMERVRFSTLAQNYDLILLDAFGVLYRDQEAIAGAAATVARLQATGQPVRVVSNNASQAPEQLQQQLSRMGFTLHLEEIFTSGMAVRPFVAASPFCTLPYYLVGTADSISAYAPDPEKLCVNQRAQEGWRSARYILLCSNRDYYGCRQQREVETLLTEYPLPILLANPDLVTPQATGGMSPVAGYTAAEWITRFRCQWFGIGKPFPPLYTLVRQPFPGLAPHRILMVGDTLDTDILGGAAQGFATCLTLSGSCAGETLEELCTLRGIRPDFVVQSIAD